MFAKYHGSKRNIIKSVKRIVNSMKQNYSLNPYTDGGSEMIVSICKYVQGIMAPTHVETEKFLKISEVYHKVNESHNKA